MGFNNVSKASPLQETKIQLMSKGLVESLGTSRFLEWEALDASRAADGVVVAC